jgi:tetratricopeptide (TPR) repeat protein
MADKDSETPEHPQDDRNIAKVDADTAGLSPEEKLILAWKKYNRPVLIAVIVLLAIVAGNYGFKSIRDKQLEGIQKEYTKANLADEAAQKSREESTNFNANKDLEVVVQTIKFAEQHPSTTLGGYARIKAGHAYMNVGNFEEAANHYKAARMGLGNTPEIAGLAQLYQAISTYRSGDKTNGKNELKLVAENKDYLHSHRGEAYYKLGVIALFEKNISDYENWEASLENANLTHSPKQWLEDLKTFRSQFPNKGFDEVEAIPAKTPASTSVTGGVSASGGISAPGNISPTGEVKKK